MGTTDGNFEGHQYFKCPNERGLFVSLRDLAKIDDKAHATVQNDALTEGKNYNAQP